MKSLDPNVFYPKEDWDAFENIFKDRPLDLNSLYWIIRTYEDIRAKHPQEPDSKLKFPLSVYSQLNERTFIDFYDLSKSIYDAYNFCIGQNDNFAKLCGEDDFEIEWLRQMLQSNSARMVLNVFSRNPLILNHKGHPICYQNLMHSLSARIDLSIFLEIENFLKYFQYTHCKWTPEAIKPLKLFPIEEIKQQLKHSILQNDFKSFIPYLLSNSVHVSFTSKPGFYYFVLDQIELFHDRKTEKVIFKESSDPLFENMQYAWQFAWPTQRHPQVYIELAEFDGVLWLEPAPF